MYIRVTMDNSTGHTNHVSIIIAAADPEPLPPPGGGDLLLYGHLREHHPGAERGAAGVLQVMTADQRGMFHHCTLFRNIRRKGRNKFHALKCRQKKKDEVAELEVGSIHLTLDIHLHCVVNISYDLMF